MATPPADPPSPAPTASRHHRAATDSPREAAPVTAAWTTTRDVSLDCPGCGAGFVLSYKYRFVDGLAATIVRCPAKGCGRGREYYLPVNAFDVLVS